MAKLVIFLVDGTTVDVALDAERVTIGRRADNHVCLPYPAVSAEHAVVVTILADSFLEDQGSTNGTLVNGKAAVKHFLRDHDQIEIGRQRLIYLSDNNARVDPLPPDIARSQLRGLTDKVEQVRPAPKVVVNPGGGRPLAAARRSVLLDGLESAVEPVSAGTAPRSPTHVPGEAHHPPLTSPPRRSTEARFVLDGKQADDLPTPDVQAEPLSTPPHPSVTVLSGPSSGRTVSFPKDQMSVGRAGVQVALVRKVPEGFILVPIEGAQPPRINGAPVAVEGSPLHPGDTFEVAGVRLQLSLG